ncbi:hypothetical protein VIN01S_00690 [Vibrio inusitatus NBRC 102082]|uniref:Uncharacterized protein n=1 Tax=Vibrio inusitatus NBRC 102082 TaxID=1219070 RepID=A0A4Y3HQD9_9VIBR|nr:hypothetical protein [Vibrio inusitatus]GEA49265.1 hypothetical protein VIN01S_00690 [Vibrio inusitatus NBRC 102082]
MNPNTFKQIYTTMTPYLKRGIPFRRKQVKRLVAIFEDIFTHEPYLNEHLDRVGKRQIIGYWRRTEHEGENVRKEKHAILSRFFTAARLKGKVPKPK